MGRTLCGMISKQTERFFYNFNTCINTCNMDYILCGMPVWKHVYHALHSCDKWFINPNKYTEPFFHEEGLNSLDEAPRGKVLSKQELEDYLGEVKRKATRYLEELTDEELAEKPPECEYTRLELILGQFRHWHCHMGNINATTMIEKNLWPKVVGLEGDADADLYE